MYPLKDSEEQRDVVGKPNAPREPESGGFKGTPDHPSGRRSEEGSGRLSGGTRQLLDSTNPFQMSPISLPHVLPQSPPDLKPDILFNAAILTALTFWPFQVVIDPTSPLQEYQPPNAFPLPSPHPSPFPETPLSLTLSFTPSLTFGSSLIFGSSSTRLLSFHPSHHVELFRTKLYWFAVRRPIASEKSAAPWGRGRVWDEVGRKSEAQTPAGEQGSL